MDTSLLKASWRAWYDWDWRGHPGTKLLVWLWTALWALFIAVVFTTLGLWAGGALGDLGAWQTWMGRNLVIAGLVAALIHLLYDLARATFASAERVARWALWQRSVFFAAVPMLGVALGWPLALRLVGLDWDLSPFSARGRNNLLGALAFSLLISLLAHFWFSMRVRRIEAERRAAEAQLRLLQGQIEPHFLFNTLATVQALMDSDLARAKAMLESFTDYLRGSLGALRRPESTLGEELDLVGNYLQLMKMRMADRLQFEIHADIALREARVPTLALQPLVENAIHHGLEPRREGGRVRVDARAEEGRLVVEVADDGLGLDQPPRRRHGAGVALANLRERLAGLYGSAAGLTLVDNHPGTRATVRLPLGGAA